MSTSRRITHASPLRFRDPLPESVDVAIIGGGAIGVFTALYLREAGKRVLICEKGRIAGEQSSRNWGWIRQQGRGEDELPIAMQSVDLWKPIDARVDGRCGLRNSGVAYLTSKERELEGFETWVETARRHGLKSQMLTAKQVVDSFSGVSSEQWLGGVHTPSDCRAEPWKAVPAVAELAHQEGVLIREDCAARKLDLEAGRITGIFTEHGRVSCEQAVLAAGAWSRLFLGAHGAKIPQLCVVATAARTAQLPDFAQANSVDEGLAWRRRNDGGYTLALADRHGFHFGPDAFASIKPWLPEMRRQLVHVRPYLAAPEGFPDGWTTKRHWEADEETPFERVRVIEPMPPKDTARRIADRFAARFPKIGRPEILDVWSGLIDAMPDIVPIVDAVPRLPGVFLSTGMSGHGFGIAPGFGRALARRLLGKDDEHDLSRFRFDRFTDGSPLRPGPSL